MKDRPDTTVKVGAVGFCYGGGVANMLAVEIWVELGAAVPFYGAQPSASAAARITAPINA